MWHTIPFLDPSILARHWFAWRWVSISAISSTDFILPVLSIIQSHTSTVHIFFYIEFCAKLSISFGSSFIFFYFATTYCHFASSIQCFTHSFPSPLDIFFAFFKFLNVIIFLCLGPLHHEVGLVVDSISDERDEALSTMGRDNVVRNILTFIIPDWYSEITDVVRYHFLYVELHLTLYTL